MSSYSPGKYAWLVTSSESFDVSDISLAPTPPSHGHVHQRSSVDLDLDLILDSFDHTESTESSNMLDGSVVWIKSSSLSQLYNSGESSEISLSSGFSSSIASSAPVDLLDAEALDVTSWSIASSSFQTSSIFFMDESLVSTKSLNAKSPRSSISSYQPDHSTITMNLPPAHQYQHGLIPDTSITGKSQTAELDIILNSLCPSELRRLLHLAVETHPSFASVISSSAHSNSSSPPSSEEQQEKKPINFIHYSNKVWHTLNPTTTSTHQNKTNQDMQTAITTIKTTILAIPTHLSNQQNPSLTTKRNALEALRKIGRAICLCTNELGNTVRFSCDKIYVNAIVQVAEGFNVEDKRILWAGGSGGEILRRWGRLEELRRGCFGGDVEWFERIGGVLDVLRREE